MSNPDRNGNINVDSNEISDEAVAIGAITETEAQAPQVSSGSNNEVRGE